VTVLQRKASMQQIGLPIMPAIKLDNENIGGHLTPLHSVIFMPTDALSVLCAQLTRDLLAIAKFLLNSATDVLRINSGATLLSYIFMM